MNGKAMKCFHVHGGVTDPAQRIRFRCAPFGVPSLVTRDDDAKGMRGIRA